jgi:YD repeat-containing protein
VTIGTAPYAIDPTSGSGSITDTNGNTILGGYSTTTSTFTDTLGTTVLTITDSGTPITSRTLTYTGPNGNASVIEKYTNHNIKTNFGCPGITEYNASNIPLISEIDLPDNTTYAFAYESTPSYPTYTTGRLASVTLPTGGTISYSYSGGTNCTDGTPGILYRTTPDSTTSWFYTHGENGAAWTTGVTDPQGNQTAMNFQGVYETERKVYQGSTLIKTIDTCYNGASIPCNSTAITLPISNRTVQVTFPNLSPSKTYTTYNTYGLPTERDQYTYGPTLARKTLVSYNTSLTNIYDRPSQVQVLDSGGTVKAKATYTYDSYGNRTGETRTNTGGSPASISRTFTPGSYDVLTGQTDFDGNPTSYGNFECANNTAFPGKITSGGLTTWLTWDCNGAVVTSVKDANNQTTTYVYNDPNFWRLTEIDYPDQGKTTISYTDSANGFSVETSRLLSTGVNHQVTRYLDGLGRIDKSVDSQASSEVDTAYDALGRVYTVSNPYASTSDPTYGLTTYSYDALSRVNSITYPDTGASSISYSGNCSTTKDPASKQRTLCSDALGRITSVTEDPGGLNYQSTYSHDALDNLTGVTQGGQTRTYNYDMLSRLTSSKTPEVNVGGTQCSTTYGYDANGNLTSKVAPSANQLTSCSSTVTTTYAYDALNRLTSKTYSDGTPPASFSYDQASVTIGSWSSGTLNYPLGRMTEATTTASGSVKTAVVYSYDPVGRISDFWQCNPANCGTSSIYSMTYSYDEAGDVTSWTHPGLISLTNIVNSAQQVTQVQTSSQYTNLPQTLAQNVTYTPWGAVSTFGDGCSGSGCTNAQETYQYTKRLQPWVISLAAASGAGSCLVYNYYSSWTPPTSCPSPGSAAPTGTTDNGNMMGYWYQDSVNSSFSHTATYGQDGVNRLSTATATGNSTYNLTFGYDAYGNMACVQNGSTNGPCPQWAYNTSTNQLTTSPCTYDAAGNLTKDCSTASNHTYQWDAEGRVSSVDPANNPPTWTFTYNALGQRVQMAGPGGTQELMYDPSGVWLGIYGVVDTLPWGGGYFAWYNGTDTYFNHINNIASTSVLTNHAGTAVEDVLFYPWGQNTWKSSGSGGYQFAGMPYYDTTTNTNLTPFRFYSPGLGRVKAL